MGIHRGCQHFDSAGICLSWNPLLNAAINGHFEVVKALLVWPETPIRGMCQLALLPPAELYPMFPFWTTQNAGAATDLEVGGWTAREFAQAKAGSFLWKNVYNQIRDELDAVGSRGRRVLEPGGCAASVAIPMATC